MMLPTDDNVGATKLDKNGNTGAAIKQDFLEKAK